MPEPSGSPLVTGACGSPELDIRATLGEAMARLRAKQVPSPALAAELLLVHATNRERTWLYTHPETRLDREVVQKYFDLIERRAAGEPTQYLTGRQEFWGLEFEVTPDVLIPRPETEHVIEVALERLGRRGIGIKDAGRRLRVADMGTGSGCLAVALARELPQAEVFATDISAPALEVAQRNADRHQVGDRVHFVRTNLLDALLPRSPSLASPAGAFDLVVSNPPYVALEQAAALPREVREHEPHAALFGGRTGVEMYARLIEQAGWLLGEGGIVVVELGYNCADHVLKITGDRPGWANRSVTNDLAGIPRVLAAERLSGSSKEG